MTSVAFTSDFHQAFKQQTSRLLRERFLWFAGIFALVSLVWLVGSLAFQLVMPLLVVAPPQLSQVTAAAAVGMVQSGLDVLCYGLVFAYALRRTIPDAKLLRLSQAVIVLDGCYSLLLSFAALHWSGWQMWTMLLPHVLAASFLPWTPGQALRPIAPILILNAVLAVLSGLMDPQNVVWSGRFVSIVLSALAPLPGIAIAALKHDSRVRSFKFEFLESRYGQIRRELTDARKIHESLFPVAGSRGSVRFDYRYQPMRLIGGDYLYARFDEGRGSGDPALTLLLLDVTGHGVAAALTVNRLYGEVERLFGENPDIGPGEVIAALNRYVYHTLANHALYVTAICARIDPAADTLEYASAGHPPAFLRAVDGTIDDLPSTTFLLGAVRDNEFEPAPERRQFVRGDTLILYTDGAMEAADEHGRQLGVTGLQRAIASCGSINAGEWPGLILTAVDRHRSGPPADDTLVVEIARLIVSDERRSDPSHVSQAPPSPPPPAYARSRDGAGRTASSPFASDTRTPGQVN